MEHATEATGGASSSTATGVAPGDSRVEPAAMVGDQQEALTSAGRDAPVASGSRPAEASWMEAVLVEPAPETETDDEDDDEDDEIIEVQCRPRAYYSDSEDGSSVPGTSSPSIESEPERQGTNGKCYCKEPVREGAIKCDTCGNLQHLECFGLSDSSARPPFFQCLECLPDLKQPKRQHFDLESIEKARTVKRQREFLVKWLGYRERTWEPEENLAGSFDVLQRFLRTKRMRVSTVKPIGGAIELSRNVNPELWVEPKKVLDFVAIHRKRTQYQFEIDIAEFGGALGQDRIELLLVNQHYYVVLTRQGQGLVIADGLNSYQHSPGVRQMIDALLGKPARPISYDQQPGVDHCGLAASLIILEMLKHLKNDKPSVPWPTEFRSPKFIRHEAISYFPGKKISRGEYVKHESASVKAYVPIDERMQKRLVCPNPGCGRSFAPRDTKGYICHNRFCRKTE